MIIHSLCVSNWKCFIDPIEIRSFSEKINIIHAPNTTGKSTLFEALRRGLLDGHRVTGKDVEAIRPWERALAPKVIVEFSHHRTGYRITKQYLDNPKAILERKEGEQFVRLAEGVEADQLCQEILTNNPPQRGLSKPDHWGLAQVLWIPQGNSIALSLTDDVAGNIQSSLGAQVTSPDAGPLEKQIEDAYQAIYTPGGKFRTGKNVCRLIQIEERLKEAVDQYNDAKMQMQAYEDSSRRVENLRSCRQFSRQNLESLRQRLKDTRIQADKYKALFSEKKQREESVKALEVRHEQIQKHIESINAIQKEIESGKSSLQKLELDLPPLQKEMETWERKLSEAKASVEDIRKNREAVDQALKLAESARGFLDTKKQLDETVRLIQKIHDAESTLHEQKEQRSQFLAPDSKTLRNLRKTIKVRDDADVRIKAASIAVEVVPEKDLKLNILSDEVSESCDLKRGIPSRFLGSPEVVLHLPDVARIRATGPESDIDKHRQEFEKAKTQIRQLTGPYGTEDIEELERLAEQAEKIDQSIRDTETQIEILLDGKEIEEIEEVRLRMESVIKKQLEENGEWAERLPDYTILREIAENTKNEFVEQIDSAEKERDSAQTAYNEVHQSKVEIDAQINELQKTLKRREEQYQDLIRDGKTPEQRDEERKTILRNLDTANIKLEDIEKELGKYVDDPGETLERLEEQVEQAQQEMEKAFQKEKQEEAKLQQLATTAPYTKLASAEERKLSLENEYHNEKERVEAIRLIYETVSHFRTEALSAVTRPVEEVATRILHKISGSGIGKIQLDQTFGSTQVRTAIYDTPVSIEQLSGGEQEQCHFATRLALAQVLAKEERQLVVLDDTMVFTDAGRFNRVLGILEEVANRLQIVILTCHPERYMGIKDISRFDLEEIVRLQNKTAS